MMAKQWPALFMAVTVTACDSVEPPRSSLDLGQEEKPPVVRDVGVEPPDAGLDSVEIQVDLPVGRLDEPYEAQLRAVGGTGQGYRWSLVSGDLPEGFRLFEDGWVRGTAMRPGRWLFVARVMDDAANEASASLTLVVEGEAPRILTTELPSGFTSRPYAYPLEVEGGFGLLTWRFASGAPPPGLSVGFETRRAVLQGTARAGGLFTFTVEVEDAGGQTDSAELTLRIVDDAVGGPPNENWSRVTDSLHLVVSASTGISEAEIVAGPSTQPGLSLELDGPELTRAWSDDGPLSFEQRGRQLDIGIPAATSSISFRVRYQLPRERILGFHEFFPDRCAESFPCRASPGPGIRYGLEIRDLPPGAVAVAPTLFRLPATGYQLGWAVAPLERIELGKTSTGLSLAVRFPSELRGAASMGTTSLLAAAEWLERTFGPYPWGNEFESVIGTTVGYALETHPNPLLPAIAASSSEIHIHELVHGWFGTAVRYACWEDAILSEGITSYLTARALEAAEGPDAARLLWEWYEAQPTSGRAAWPGATGDCNQVTDIWRQAFAGAVYYRSARFLREVERRIGRAVLDRALARVPARYSGQAIRFGVVLDEIEAESGWDPSACAEKWLTQLGTPSFADRACR